MVKPNVLGNALRISRRLKGLTLRDVSSISGVSNPYLSQLETGKILTPSPRILAKIAKALDTPYDYLMEAAGYTDGHADAAGMTKEMAAKAREGRLASLIICLTPDEQAKVADYVSFVVSQRKREK